MAVKKKGRTSTENLPKRITILEKHLADIEERQSELEIDFDQIKLPHMIERQQVQCLIAIHEQTVELLHARIKQLDNIKVR